MDRTPARALHDRKGVCKHHAVEMAGELEETAAGARRKFSRAFESLGHAAFERSTRNFFTGDEPVLLAPMLRETERRLRADHQVQPRSCGREFATSVFNHRTDCPRRSEEHT